MTARAHEESDLDCAQLAGTPAPAAGHANRLAFLLQTIEREIIPRLMLAHRGAGSPAAEPATGAMPDGREVEALAELLVRGDGDSVNAFVAGVRTRGVSPEAVLLALLAPAARRLGRMWEADQCDFTAVTTGLWRLQRALYEVSPAFQLDAQPPADGRRALLTAVPGEQHTFGLFMVAEFFRRAGWDVVDAPFASADGLVDAAERDWYAVIGLSIGAERWVDRLSGIIADLRRRSCNGNVGIIVGGPLAHLDPRLASRVGADRAALDARDAVDFAQDLLPAARRPC